MARPAADGPPGFTITRELGRGQNIVYEGTRDLDGTVCALKKIDTRWLSREQEAIVIEEINILRGLHHPGILRYIGMHRGEDDIFVITEVCIGGSLEDRVARLPGRRLPSEHFGVLARALLEAVHYLHLRGIIHRDIKVSHSRRRLFDESCP